jgi:glyoxylase-like metal-dependent hydrolase (beta-lactamase superfamily II)
MRRWLLIALVACSSSPGPPAAEPRTPPAAEADAARAVAAPAGVEITELADGSIAWTTQPWTANSLLVRTGSGDIILVDTPTTPADTAALIDWIEARWRGKVRWAINSHWHADASGGNQVLLARGAEVISSQRTAELVATRGHALRADLIETFGQRDPETAAELAELRPTPATRKLEIDGRVELDLGGERVALIFPGPSHSEDSIAIHFPARRLLYGGCAVRSDGKIVNQDGADPNWPAAIDTLIALDPAIVVPGHGRRFDPAMLPESAAAARELFAKE